jgi:methionine-rich copper-binding protein CopC
VRLSTSIIVTGRAGKRARELRGRFNGGEESYRERGRRAQAGPATAQLSIAFVLLMCRHSLPYLSLMRLSAFHSIIPAALIFAGVTAFAPATPAVPASGAARFHAHLVRAEPAVNDTIAATPTAVRLWFSEPVELGLSRVKIMRVGGDTLKTSGLRRADSAPTSAALDLSTAPTAPGTYVVTYHVVARDGHPTTGSYNFVLKGAGAK